MKFHAMRDWIRKHKIVSGFGATLVLLLALSLVVRYRAMWRLAEYKQQLIAHGEKLTIAELIPLLPSGSNGGPAILRAVRSIPKTFPQPLAMRMVQPGVARVTWQQGELFENVLHGGTTLFTNIWPLIEEQWESLEEPHAVLRTAAGSPVISFDVRYADGFAAMLPHLEKCKKASCFLSTAALYNLHKGDAKTALQDLCAALSLSEHYHEPLIISQQVRLSMTSLQFNVTWEALQFKNWTDDELQQLQDSWQRVDFISDAQSCSPMERGWDLKCLGDIRRSYTNLDLYGDNFSSSGNGGDSVDELIDASKRVLHDPMQVLRSLGTRYPGYWWYCWCWTYDDERALIHSWQVMREEFQASEKSFSFSRAIDFDHDVSTLDGMNLREANEMHYVLTQMVMPTSRFFYQVAAVQTQKEMAVTAIALKRFSLQEKKYPAQLDELVPRYLKAAPHDFYDGQSLRYELKRDGSFLLYSIGPDGVDDHGDVTQTERTFRPVWLKSRDLVWPRAATPTEAAVFTDQQIASAMKFATAGDRYGLNAPSAFPQQTNPPAKTGK